MALAFRWLFRLFVGLLLLAGLALLIAYWFASRSLPDYSQRIEVPGLSAPVEIVRNNANVSPRY